MRDLCPYCSDDIEPDDLTDHIMAHVVVELPEGATLGTDADDWDDDNEDDGDAA